MVPYVNGEEIIKIIKSHYFSDKLTRIPFSLKTAIALALILYALGFIPLPPFYNIGGMAAGFLHAFIAEWTCTLFIKGLV